MVLQTHVSTLVDDVLDLSATAVLGLSGYVFYGLWRYLLLLVPEVQFQDAFSFGSCGQTCPDFQVESARSEKGLVYHILSVGGTDNQNVAVFVEAIHLCQQLVDS